MRVPLTISLLLTLVLVPSCSRREIEPPRTIVRVGWDEVLAWLPPDTESVLALNGPIGISELKELPAEATLPASRSLGLVFARDSVRPLLGEMTVQLALTAGREFRSPRSLGMTLFEGACIVVIAPNSAPAGVRWFQTLRDEADRRQTLADVPVAVFNERWEADDVTLWSARPREDVLVTATDSEFLEQVIRGIRGEANERPRALRPDLSEWEHVDMGARCWGLRHYRRPATGTDPTSPLSGGSPVFGRADPGAIGCVYSSAPSDRASIRAVYLSSSDDALDWVRAEWMPQPQQAIDVPWSLATIAPGVIEIRSSETSPGSIYWFVFFSAFGHAIYL